MASDGDNQRTWHISTVEMYPAIMESLVSLHDRVKALGSEVAQLRTEIQGMPARIESLESSRLIAVVASAVVVIGLVVVTVLKI